MNIARATSLEGFICPACLVDFPGATKLQDHWMKFHSPKTATVRSSKSSNDYEEIPDDIPRSHATQVCDFWCFEISDSRTVEISCIHRSYYTRCLKLHSGSTMFKIIDISAVVKLS